MNTRHRTPTIFNLSMVDVMCCTLGCLILLWLVASQDAKQKAAEAGKVQDSLKETADLLAAMTDKYKDSEYRREQVQAEHALAVAMSEDLQKKLSLTEADRQKLGAELVATAGRILSLQKELEARSTDLQAKQKLLDARNKELEDKVAELALAAARISALDAKVKKSDATITVLAKQTDTAGDRIQSLEDLLKAADARVLDLSGTAAEQRKVIEDLEKLLAGLKLENQDYLSKLKTTQTAAADLQKQLRDKSKDATSLDTDLARTKKDLDARLKELADVIRERNTLREQVLASYENLKLARRSIDSLTEEKTDLLQKELLLKAAIQNRFAGIELTGRKVLFLVDVSGSMRMKDEKTMAPDKWPIVCDTIAKLMSSLPNLTHYQVIVFGESVEYPLQNQGEWLPYDPQTSPASLLASLRKIQPNGGTKMRPALEEAFGKFKGQGLDTIYLVSDGLPNDDDNLPNDVQQLTGVQRTAYLSNQVRNLLRTRWNAPAAGGDVPVRINALGFFFESPEVGSFLWALARENDGSFVGMSRP